jgi:hypothetical protein
MTYEQVMIIKNATIYLGGIFTGLFIGCILLHWFIRTGTTDKEMTTIKIMRIKRNKKYLYVWNPLKFGSVVHTVLIIFGWQLGLIRKNSVYYEDAKVSKTISWIVISIAILAVLLSLYWIFGILHVDGHVI